MQEQFEIDFQHRYILCMLLSLRKRGIGFVDDGFGFAEDATNWKVLYEKLQKASTVGISLMVVDGLTEKTKSTLPKAYTPLLLQSKGSRLPTWLEVLHIGTPKQVCRLVFRDLCVQGTALAALTEAAVLPAALHFYSHGAESRKAAAGHVRDAQAGLVRRVGQ